MTRALCLGLLAFTLTGCGTVLNMGVPTTPLASGEDRFRIYGGVANDVVLMKLAAADDWKSPNLAAAAVALDMPLSVIADTLTLPLTLSIAVGRALENRHKQTPKPSPDAKPKPDEKGATPERIHGGII